MYLEKGFYRFSFHPCTNFTLRRGENIYHTRDFSEPTTQCDINVVRSDNYSANLPFKAVRVSDVQKQGKGIILPTQERNRIKDIKIVRNNSIGSTPARIFTGKSPAIIEVSDYFYSLPEQWRLFIICHEYAHLFYKTEWKTDVLGLRLFLGMGGNPSQALYALSKILKRKPENMHRIQTIFDTLKYNGYVS